MDGNVMLSTELDTRPVTQSLSNLKRKIVEVFKGADIKSLQLGLKEVTAEIKATEAQARKAQTALDALMSGEKTPQSIKNLERDLKLAQKESDTLDAKWRKLKATSAELQASINAGTLTPAKERAAVDKLASVREELRAVQQAANEADAKVVLLQKSIRFLKQNPELTPEAQRYLQVLDETSRKLPELQAKYNELGQTAQKVGLATRLQQTSVVAGFQHIERRIIGLAKRVFFFTLITKALRAVRSQISALIAGDSQLSASLAQVKANLAASFGMIWQAVVPALRTMIAWLAKATSYIAAFISWLTGKSFKSGQQTMQAISDASGATAGNTGKIGKAAKKAAKELNRMLLPFDQMNVLSKDTADGGGGAGGAGGAGAGGLGGLAMPKEMDGVIAKFEKFKDLILLIGAAFAAWKLSKIASTLLGISRIKAFIGLTALIAGIALLVVNIRDLIKNGPNVENVCGIIAGGLLTIGGAVLLLTGATGLGLIIVAIGLLVLAFKNLYKNFAPFKKYIDNALKSIKKAFGKGKLKGFAEIGKQILLGVLKGIVWVVKRIGKWLKKNVLDKIIKGFKNVFGISSPAKKMLDIGKDIMLGVLDGILEPMKKIGNWIQEHVLTPIKEALFGGEDSEGLFVDIGVKFSETKETLKAKWEDIKAGIAETWAIIKSKFEDTKETLKAKWESIKESVKETWAVIKSKFEDTKDTLSQKWNNIKAGIAETYAEIKSKFEDTKDTLTAKWNNIKGSIVNTTATITAAVQEKTKGMLDKVKGVFNYGGKTVTATISTAIKGAKVKTLQKLAKALGKIKWGNKVLNATINLKSAVATGYNAAAKKINGLIDKLPKLVKPNWRLPTLAQGAVIPANKEFLAVLGDQKRGVNIETPLQTMIDAFNTALNTNGFGGSQNVNVYLQGDAKQLFKVVRVEANNYTQSTGKAAFNL